MVSGEQNRALTIVVNVLPSLFSDFSCSVEKSSPNAVAPMMSSVSRAMGVQTFSTKGLPG